MRDTDLNVAARIDEAIEATGATVTDFDVHRRPGQGLGEAMNIMLGGPKPTQFVFTVEPDGMVVDGQERADGASDDADDDRPEAAVVADVLTAIWGANLQAPVEELDADHLLKKLTKPFDDETVAKAVSRANWDVDEHIPDDVIAAADIDGDD
jgi:hypothetical protein